MKSKRTRSKLSFWIYPLKLQKVLCHLNTKVLALCTSIVFQTNMKGIIFEIILWEHDFNLALQTCTKPFKDYFTKFRHTSSCYPICFSFTCTHMFYISLFREMAFQMSHTDVNFCSVFRVQSFLFMQHLMRIASCEYQSTLLTPVCTLRD